ncbi:pso2 [Candida oxycetoniae]|uniref:Pso2 n=1 Tax=Candida oxycetoniae TaxID=497107 RepID=A0AAI9SY84_9ASCO|nr:pso2 [Candida oxycetoniae]KAI3404946.2 pso2 [Candida oxycetoniae]
MVERVVNTESLVKQEFEQPVKEREATSDFEQSVKEREATLDFEQPVKEREATSDFGCSIYIKKEGECALDPFVEKEQEKPKACSKIYTTEKKIDAFSSTQATSASAAILCPVCDLDLHELDLRSRTDHVDTCLVRVTFDESETSQQDIQLVERKQTSIKKETIEVLIPPVEKKRKVEKDKIRYINAETNISSNKPKIIKPPSTNGVNTKNGSTVPIATTTTTTRNISSRKKPISPLKIMTFPVNNHQKLDYQVSVDAFCFAPHETIDQYFLTHFHADHYGGISKKWSYERVFKEDTDYENDSKYKRIIYCTAITGKLLTLYFSIDPRFIKMLKMDTKYKVKNYGDDVVDVEDGGYVSNEESPGFIGRHDIENTLKIDKVYLDTTYMNKTYVFPKQELVCETAASLFENLTLREDDKASNSLFNTWFGLLTQSRITDFWKSGRSQAAMNNNRKKKKFLILVGTYVIGKEKLAIAISKRLQCPIYVSNINNRRNKYEILKTYQDDYLDSVLTADDLGRENPSDCIVHLVPMSIVGSIQELSNYFNHNKYYENFERCVGLRPTGWSFAQNGKNTDSPSEAEDLVPQTPLEEVIRVMTTTTNFTFMDHILSQGSKNTSVKGQPDQELYRIYSLPYSEHSSFRELAYFVVFFNIGRVIPTVNCNNEFNLKRMEDIIATWEQVRRIKTNTTIDKDLPISDEIVEKVNEISLDTF